MKIERLTSRLFNKNGKKLKVIESIHKGNIGNVGNYYRKEPDESIDFASTICESADNVTPVDIQFLCVMVLNKI